MKISDIPRTPPSILLFGRPGSGKTTLIETLGERLILISTDQGGWTPALTFKDKFSEDRMKVDVWPCLEDPDRPGSGHTKVKEAILKIKDMILAKTLRAQAVCLDSLTTLGDQAMRYVLANSGVLDRGMIKGKFKDGKIWSGIEIGHYGIAMTEIENCLAGLRSLPLMTAVIAHDDVEKIEEIPTRIVSVIGNKLAPRVPSYFDEVWYTMIVQRPGGITEAVMQSSQHPAIISRSRGGLPNGTSQSLGMVEILKKIGFEFPTQT